MNSRVVVKLLSGSLQGVEYTLVDGDWLFRVGPASALLDGSAAEALARADNTFYIPDDVEAGSFVVRVTGGEGKLGRCVPPDEERVFNDMPMQVGVSTGCLWIAIRHADARWSSEVLSFRVPGGLQVVRARQDPSESFFRSRRLKFATVALLVFGLTVCAVWQYFSPVLRVRSLGELLKTGPETMLTRAGRDSSVYVIAHTKPGMAWARRAATRTGQSDGVRFVNLADEVARVGSTLDRARIEYVVLRMDDPVRPQLILSGNSNRLAGLIEPVRNLLLAQLPYAEEVRVETLTDEQLFSIAESGLRRRGVVVRREGQSARVVITNTGFLDDARMHAMSDYISSFERDWGTRRVGFRFRQWDDLLGSASYQYDAKRLYSVGANTWRFSLSNKD